MRSARIVATVLSAGAAAAHGAGWFDSSAGLRIDHVGTPWPVQISVDAGSCDPVQAGRGDNSDLVFAECGVPLGKRRISVKCADPQLPPAVLEWDVPKGQSHYIQFRNVCSSSSAEILRENERKQERMVWETKR